MNTKVKYGLLKILIDNFDYTHLNQLIERIPQKTTGILKVRNNTSNGQIELIKKRMLENNKNIDFIYDFLSNDGFNSIVDKENIEYKDIDFSTQSKTIDDLKKLADFHPAKVILTIIKVLDDREIDSYFNGNPDELAEFMKKMVSILDSRKKLDKNDSLNCLKAELNKCKKELESNRTEINLLNKRILKFNQEKEKLVKKYQQKLNKSEKERKDSIEEAKSSFFEMEKSYNERLSQIKEENMLLLNRIKDEYQKIIDKISESNEVLKEENNILKNELNELKSEEPKFDILILGKVTPTFKKSHPKIKFTVIERENFSVEKLSKLLEKKYTSIWLMTSQYTSKMERTIKNNFPDLEINKINSLIEFKFTEEI